MRILFLEPFDGGSHREFVEGLREHSRHAIDVQSLPARLWKWRLRAAGLTLAQRVAHPERYDLVIATGLLDLAQVRAVWGARTPPVLLYLHESQVSYPVPAGGSAGAELLWRDVTNVAVADHVVFNSQFHRAAFRKRLPEVIEQLPDEEARPEVPLATLDRRSSVLYPGCRFPGQRAVRPAGRAAGGDLEPPLGVRQRSRDLRRRPWRRWRGGACRSGWRCWASA